MKRAAQLAIGGVAARAMRLRIQAAVASGVARQSVVADGARALSTAGQGGIPKSITSTNPFEIKVHVEDVQADAAEELAGVESCSIEDETKKSHSDAATQVSGSEDERVFHLPNNCRVSVDRWESAVLVDIRKYYDDNGVTKPGAKGLSLPKDQWNTLMRMASVIDEAVALVEDDNVAANSMKHVKEKLRVNDERTIAFALSSKRRITVRFFRSAVLIDLRMYYKEKNSREMQPGRKGISLSKDQWRSLQQIEAKISQAVQEV